MIESLALEIQVHDLTDRMRDQSLYKPSYAEIQRCRERYRHRDSVGVISA